MAETWYLLQVNLDRTDPGAAKEFGQYWIVHWMIPLHVDCQSTSTHRWCWFWPEQHVLTANPLEPHRKIVPV